MNHYILNQVSMRAHNTICQRCKTEIKAKQHQLSHLNHKDLNILKLLHLKIQVQLPKYLQV